MRIKYKIFEICSSGLAPRESMFDKYESFILSEPKLDTKGWWLNDFDSFEEASECVLKNGYSHIEYTILPILKSE